MNYNYESDDHLEDICFRLAETETCIFGDECPNQHDSHGMCIAAASVKKNAKKNNGAKNNGTGSARLSSMTMPLQAFFAKYPPFIYDPSKSASSEFYRLCNYFQWERDNADRTAAHEAFKTALVKQFNVIYGTNENSLAAWQKLCKIVNVNHIPVRVADCRQAVRNVHVNLVDLVDREFTGASIPVFPSEVALNEYTRKTGKFFPRQDAHAGGLLKVLLTRRGGRGSGGQPRSKSFHK